MCKNPDGSFKEKIVTRDWLKDNIYKSVLDNFYKSEKEKGWILFSRSDAALKLVKDPDEVKMLLQDKNIRPIYEYNKKRRMTGFIAFVLELNLLKPTINVSQTLSNEPS